MYGFLFLTRMLKSLFSSTTRIKVLRAFLMAAPGTEYFVRELTRDLSEQINSVRRELANLEKIGMLRSVSRDRKKFYRLNPSFPILAELRAIFQKSDGLPLKIARKLGRMGRLDLLILSGVFQKTANQHIDLVAVGRLDKDKLARYLGTELAGDMQHEIRYSVFTREDFLYRLECKDRFATSMIENSENMMVVNTIV